MMVSEQEPKTAADWLARLRGTDDPDTLEAYERWLDAHPENRASAENLEDMWQLVGALENDPIVQSILAPEAQPAPEQRPSFFQRLGLQGSHLPRFATAALLSLSLVVALLFVWRAVHGADVYQTVAGEQRIVDLADGSRLHLNVATRLEVSLRDDARKVHLAQGQAFFEISPDASRPFIVTAGDKEITVIGTKFDVMLQGGDTRVTVIEGRVAVTSLSSVKIDSTTTPTDLAQVHDPRSGTPSPQDGHQPTVTTLDGQQRLELSADHAISWPQNAPPVVIPTTSAIDSAEAWRDGKVVFERTPLGDAVTELDRYAPLAVRLASVELSSMQVSGVFYIDRLSDVDALVFALESSLPISAERRGEELILRASD